MSELKLPATNQAQNLRNEQGQLSVEIVKLRKMLHEKQIRWNTVTAALEGYDLGMKSAEELGALARENAERNKQQEGDKEKS